VISGTSFASCKAYPNTATASATNHANVPASDTTTVLCPDLNLAKVADDASVNAGQQIGFTITASNSAQAAGTAAGVVINDPLPSGSGVSWSISPATTGCSITTNPDTGAQTLHCNAVDLAPGASESVHVISGTSFASCKAYPNTATASATNHANVPASDTTTVLCADLALTKTADAASVNAGQQIGFTIATTNTGAGDAVGVVVEDLLPAGSGVNWSIASGPGNCSITGSPASQTLICTAVTLAPGAGESVHVVSATSSLVSCGAYPNTANLTASNHPVLTATASTQVVNCVVVSPPKQQPHPHVLPNTGGPNGWLFTGGLALLVAGGSLVLTDQRRRRRS
jgi:uncharacterized repeat protein (TIGR01451 family)/LPXTG-motif cell wall-anchored protein